MRAPARSGFGSSSTPSVAESRGFEGRKPSTQNLHDAAVMAVMAVMGDVWSSLPNRQIAHGMRRASCPSMKNIVPSLLFVGCFLVTASARADMPPPDGTKRVPYTFTVHGIASAGPDTAMFSYPCSGTDGQPRDAVTMLSEGDSVAVGRNEGCSIYRVPRSAYADWKKHLDDSVLVTAATKCSGDPSPLTEVDADDARSSINEDLDVKVDATGCSVTSRAVPKPSGGGCNATGATSRASLALLLGLPAMLMLLVRKRRAPASR